MSVARLLAALVASLLLVASAVAIERTAEPDGATGQPGAAASEPPADGGAPATPAPTDPSATPQPTEPVISAEDRLALLTSVEAAADAGAEALLAAGLETARAEWRTLSDPAWPVRDERPVYVAEAEIVGEAERIEADLVIAWRPDADADEVVLRALAASQVLQDAGGAFTVTASLDDEEIPVTVDPDGARLILEGSVTAGQPHLVRLSVSYDLVDRGRVSAGVGGPAGWGLLARSPATADAPLTANLGHWLPLLTFDPSPMVPWGDVGAFPVAIWSVLVDHGGALVTGGADGACPEQDDAGVTGCTWGRGLALRDVSAVWFADRPTVDQQQAGRVAVNAVIPAGTFSRQINRQALLESVLGIEVFTETLGPLAWREFDVVAAPLLEGAAGMEFPGLVIIDLDVYGSLEGRVGTYVLAHEVAHQWFHALVGNSSIESPVVDESLAQYLSVVFWVVAYGEAAADELVASAIRGRYEAARQRGLDDAPPAQPLEDFQGDGDYGPLVYARAPLAWLAAEDALGRDRVLSFLRSIVGEYGLDVVSDDQLLDEATAFDPELGEILQRYWFDPEPVATPSG